MSVELVLVEDHQQARLPAHALEVEEECCEHVGRLEWNQKLLVSRLRCRPITYAFHTIVGKNLNL